MERALTFFRTYPVLFGFAIFLVITVTLLAIFAVAMTRSGMSLKPLVFLGVYFAIIVGPQLFYHVQRARGKMVDINWRPPSVPAQHMEVQGAFAHQNGRFSQPDLVFGAGYDKDLLVDVRGTFVSPAPEIAQMAVFRTAETVVLARFANEGEAATALHQYARAMGLRLSHPAEDGSYTARRASDWVRFLRVDRNLFTWSGADPAALDRRMQASSGSWTTPNRQKIEMDPRVAQARRAMLFILPALVFIAVLWFFKGSTWAASISPKQNLHLPTPAGELQSRLLAIQALDQPISITRGEQPNEIVVTWRADAKWIDLANAHGLRRKHKLVLRLDESNHFVRVHEYWTTADWSAGLGGAQVKWRRSKGITFFQRETQRVYGLQLDPTTGRVKPELSYTYTFNLQEIKAPLIEVVTHAGWTWRPVHFDAPTGLKWLVN